MSLTCISILSINRNNGATSSNTNTSNINIKIMHIYLLFRYRWLSHTWCVSKMNRFCRFTSRRNGEPAILLPFSFSCMTCIIQNSVVFLSIFSMTIIRVGTICFIIIVIFMIGAVSVTAVFVTSNIGVHKGGC